jgi:DNA-binding MarR family transcriptional regulator
VRSWEKLLLQAGQTGNIVSLVTNRKWRPVTEHAHLELDHFLPYRLSVLSNRISQEIARLYAERFALNVTEWRLLAVLGRYPDLTATELVERTAMDKVAVSRAVASLVADGRLTRKVDGEDRRRTKLRLSAKGYRIYDEVAPLALAYQQRLVAALDAGERAQLEALLSRLNVQNAG